MAYLAGAVQVFCVRIWMPPISSTLGVTASLAFALSAILCDSSSLWDYPYVLVRLLIRSFGAEILEWIFGARWRFTGAGNRIHERITLMFSETTYQICFKGSTYHHSAPKIKKSLVGSLNWKCRPILSAIIDLWGLARDKWCVRPG